MKYALLLVLVLLSGCSLTDQICKDAVITDKTVHVDPRALEECKDLILLPDKATFHDVLANTTENAILYKECRNKQTNSTVLIKRFANIK